MPNKKKNRKNRENGITCDQPPAGSERNDSLWDNPAVRSARASLSDKQLADYKKAGEDMYEGIDFENPLVQQTTDGIEYIKSGLNAGMSPRDLTENEQNLMENIYGPTWFLTYGGMGDPLGSESDDRSRKEVDKGVDRVLHLMGVKQKNFLDKLPTADHEVDLNDL